MIEAEENLTEIKNLIINDHMYKNLFKATAIPFCMSVPDFRKDIGTILEDDWLPLLKEYEKQVPGTYFKATLQGNTELKNSLSISENSGYDILNKCTDSYCTRIFFPDCFSRI